MGPARVIAIIATRSGARRRRNLIMIESGRCKHAPPLQDFGSFIMSHQVPVVLRRRAEFALIFSPAQNLRYLHACTL